MLPANKNFVIYRGDAFEQSFIFKSDDGTSQTVEDLSGLVISAKVKDGTDIDSELIFTFRVDRDDTEGCVRLYLLPEDTKLIESGKYKWDLQIGDYTKLLGNVQLVGDISDV